MFADCWFTHDAPINMNFTEIGNPMFLGIAEELMEERVNAACAFIENSYGYEIPYESFKTVLEEYDIDLSDLPRWLFSKFDKFKIVA